MKKSDKLRQLIFKKVKEFYALEFPPSQFIAGTTSVPVSGRVFDENELLHLVDASLDCWLTTGRFAEKFEAELSRFMGIRNVILCNSGSSANLLAITALTAAELGQRRLRPGDEVITAAAGFPSTVNPIIQNQLKPVFIDIEPETYNIDIDSLKNAIGPKTKAIIAAHTLGNPFKIDQVLEIAKNNKLWLIEDNCDALGATFDEKLTGTFGDMSTLSFYPAHHITMGEGGCVLTNNNLLKKLLCSFRDWGRDCWCDPGKENTCGKRFQWQLGNLPFGYDHKYIYSRIGYNLKITDMQAAVGLAQMKKLKGFIKTRQRNWHLLAKGLEPLKEFLILPKPTPHSNPSWFGFLITVMPNAPFSRNDIIAHLEKHKVATRLLFGGNLVSQPAYKDVEYQTVGDLKNSDVAMNRSFWIGVYPGINKPMIEYVIKTIKTFIKEHKK